jgi:hypothetical protein
MDRIQGVLVSKQEYGDWGLLMWSCGFGAVVMTVLAVLEFTK